MKINIYYITLALILSSCGRKINFANFSNFFATSINSNSTSLVLTDGYLQCVASGKDANGNYYSLCATSLEMFADSSNNGAGELNLIKMNNSGELLWATPLNSNSYPLLNAAIGSADGYNEILSVDNSGNSVVVFRTSDSLVETHAGGTDSVILKIDNNGDLVWAKQIGVETTAQYAIDSGFAAQANGNEIFNGIETLSNGDVILMGSTTSDFADDNANTTEDLLIVKLSAATGEIIKAVQFGTNWQADYIANGGYASSSTAGQQRCRYVLDTVEVDSFDNSYFVCQTNSGLVSAVSGYDIIYGKFNSNLELQYLRQVSEAQLVAYRALPGSYSAASNTGYESGDVIKMSRGQQSVIVGFHTTGNLADVNRGSRDSGLLTFSASTGDLEMMYQSGVNSGVGSTDSEVFVTSVAQTDKGNYVLVGSTYGDYIPGESYDVGKENAYISLVSVQGAHIRSSVFKGVLGQNSGNDEIRHILYSSDKDILVSWHYVEGTDLDASTNGTSNFYRLTLEQLLGELPL